VPNVELTKVISFESCIVQATHTPTTDHTNDRLSYTATNVVGRSLILLPPPHKTRHDFGGGACRIHIVA